jgi:hypothetical protein
MDGSGNFDGLESFVKVLSLISHTEHIKDHMKKLILFVAVITLLIFSCRKKQTPVPIPKGISATINGKDHTFNLTDSVYFGTAGYNGYEFNIYATGASADTDYVLSVIVGSPSQIIPGTYTTSTGLGIGYTYYIPNTNYGDDYGTSQNSQTSGTITVTSTSNNNIQGYFSGVLTPVEGEPAGNPIRVTNGKFNVDYK